MSEQTTPTTGTVSGWPIAVSASCWMLMAVLMVPAWAGLQADSTVDDETLGTLRSTTDDLAAPGGDAPFPPFVLIVVAVLLALAALACAFRYRVARFPAVVLGAAAVVLLALGARWETVPAMILLVIGTIPLLIPSVVRRMR